MLQVAMPADWTTALSRARRSAWRGSSGRRACVPLPSVITALHVSENVRVSRSPNFCAGSYGAIYDFCVERERLMRAVGRAVCGIDMSVLYASMEAIGRVSDGATILDAPCGGGVALRALRPDQDVRYVAADLSQQMLARAQRRAKKRSLSALSASTAAASSESPTSVGSPTRSLRCSSVRP
jgi:Methyltransferase domain